MAEILDDPIDWTRDKTKLEVPSEASINANVCARWTEINIAVFDGVPVEYQIQGASEAILDRKRLIAEGKLDSRYDWKHDLEIARSSHRFHSTNLEHVRNKRNGYIGFWTNWTTEANRFHHEMSLNGLKTIFLFHGAIALGALNILAQSEAPTAQIAVTAKYAIVFAAIGIISAGVGQIIIFYFGTIMAWRIRSKLTADVKWNMARAISRYFKRYSWLPLIGNKAVYGSMFWFATYVLILLIMLVSA